VTVALGSVPVGTESRSSRRRLSLFEVGDGVTFLTVYIFLLFAIPSRLIFAPLGGAGTPALLVGVFGSVWWAWYHLHRSTRTPSQFPQVRLFVMVFCGAVLVSYVAAMSRPIVDAEVSTADLGLIAVLGWAGIALVAHDGIPNLGRMTTLVNRLAVAGGCIAALGILQFVTKQSWVDQIDIPGLSSNQALGSILGRNGFARPAGTAIHPIEFGVALTVVLPFALHRAFYSTWVPRVRRWLPLVAITIAIPISISRSAILGATVVLIILLPVWSKVRRRLALASIVSLGTLIFLTIPGMLGTLTSLFTGISTDTSATSRTDSYALAWEFITRSPLVGRGFSTFLPSYRILDNQYLLSLIELGILGLLAFLAMVVAAVLAAKRAARSTRDEATQHLCMAVLAAVAAAGVSLALFDALSFPMVGGLLFLTVGMAGALRRIIEAQDQPTTV
jgi:polysaccharide biosynthesis protein PslJ